MGALIPEIMDDVRPPSGQAQVVLVIDQTHFRQLDLFDAPCSVEDVLREYAVPLKLDWRVIVNDRVIPREDFGASVIQPGDIVMIRLVPGTSIAFLIISLAMSIGLQMIQKLLAPPPKPPGANYQATPKRYSISGSSNELAPFAQIPKVFGRRKVYPMLAARTFTEIEGHDQYLRMLLTPGYGPIEVSQLKIGDTDLSEFDDVDVEILGGYPDDPPQTIYTDDVQESTLDVLLCATNDWQNRPDWRLQTSAINADELSVDVSFPKGLISYNNAGDHEFMQVTLEMRYAIRNSNNWINLPNIVVTGSTAAIVRKSRRWAPAQAGQQWDVQIRAVKRQWASDAVTWQFETRWSAIRTIRHTAPVVIEGLCLIGLRIRASNQLSGTVDQLSCVAQGVVTDWDGTVWDKRAGSWHYGWVGSGASYDLDTGEVHTGGGKSLKLTDGSGYGVASAVIPCLEGDGFQISGWYKGSGTVSVKVYWGKTDEFASSGGDYISNDVVLASGSAGGSWAQANGKVIAPADAKYFRVVVVLESGGPAYFDDMAVMFLHHKQRSDDLIQNNSFEEVDADKQPNDWELDWAVTGTGPLVYKCKATAHEGKYGLQINPTSSGDGGAAASESIPVIAGETFEVYGWVKGSAAAGSGARMRVSYGNTPGHALSQEVSGADIYNGSLGTGWKKCSGTVTVPGGVTYMRVVVYNWQTGKTVYWDDMHCVPLAGSFTVVNTRLANPSFDYPGQATSNPASIYRNILQGAGNKRPLPDNRIKLSKLEVWHDDCASTGREFNGVLDKLGTVFDALRDVAAFGRAGFAMDGNLYSVVEDKAQSTIVQHVTPRNSWGYKGRRNFDDLPHAFKVRWINPDAEWQQDELLVYADGYNGSNATKFEALDLTAGCTNRDLAWRDGRFHYYTRKLRPDQHEFNMDWENLALQRGDLIRFAHDVPQFGLGWGRVKTLNKDGGNNLLSVTTDESFNFEAGKNYCVRFRKSDGSSVLANLTNPVTETNLLTFATPIPVGNPQPLVGDLAVFGEQGTETTQLMVASIEYSRDLTALVSCVAYDASLYTKDSGNAPGGGLEPPAPVPAPEIAGVSSDESVLIRDAQGTLQPRIVIGIAPIVGGALLPSDLKGIQVHYRENAENNPDGPWSVQPLNSIDSNIVVIEPVRERVAYDIILRYEALDGRVGTWTEINNHVVIGKTSPPPDVTGFAAQKTSAGTILLTWDLCNVLDFDHFEIREGVSAGGSYATIEDVPDIDALSDFDTLTEPGGGGGGETAWADAVLVTKTTGVRFEIGNPASGAHTYQIKAVDTSGNESLTASLASLTWTPDQDQAPQTASSVTDIPQSVIFGGQDWAPNFNVGLGYSILDSNLATQEAASVLTSRVNSPSSNSGNDVGMRLSDLAFITSGVATPDINGALSESKPWIARTFALTPKVAYTVIPEFVGSSATGDNANRLYVTKPSKAIGDDVAIVSVAMNANNTCTPPFGWTEIGSSILESGHRLYAFFKVIGTSGEPSQWQFNLGASSFCKAICSVYRGVLVSNPINSYSGTSGSSAAPHNPSSPTNTDNCMLVWVVAWFNDGNAGIVTHTAPANKTGGTEPTWNGTTYGYTRDYLVTWQKQSSADLAVPHDTWVAIAVATLDIGANTDLVHFYVQQKFSRSDARTDDSVQLRIWDAPGWPSMDGAMLIDPSMPQVNRITSSSYDWTLTDDIPLYNKKLDGFDAGTHFFVLEQMLHSEMTGSIQLLVENCQFGVTDYKV